MVTGITVFIKYNLKLVLGLEHVFCINRLFSIMHINNHPAYWRSSSADLSKYNHILHVIYQSNNDMFLKDTTKINNKYAAI